MGKKSNPKAPAAPDPVATANAQAEANKTAAVAQANLNRIDQYTPQGSLTYQQIGTNSDGTPRYSQTQTLSPEQQQLYNQGVNVDLALSKLAGDNIGRVQQAQSTPFSYDGMTPLQTGVNSGPIQYGNGPNPVRTGVSPAGGIQTTFGTGPDLQRLNGSEGANIQTALDYSGAAKLPGTDDFSADARRVSDAVYSQAASRLDPQFQQQENDLRSRLAASGISENSDAFRREMDNFARQRADAYNQANYSAIQAGGNEQSRIFGLALGARQQGVNETNAQGQFANQAQGQIFDQASGAAGFNNQAAGQQYGQNLGAAQFGNEAQGQQYGQNAQDAQFFNDAQNQQFQQGQQSTATFNTAQNQQFNQNANNAAFNNQARQQQIQEAAYLRNLPLNDIAALLGTGQGVQTPEFNPVSQVGVAAPDYQGAVYANYNAANQQYQQKLQARSQGLGSIFGLAGSLGAAAISDRRLKTAVRRIGTLANGLATYAYRYIGDAAEQFGVMAQEALNVVPEAVGSLADGTLYVKYGKVW